MTKIATTNKPYLQNNGFFYSPDLNEREKVKKIRKKQYKASRKP